MQCGIKDNLHPDEVPLQKGSVWVFVTVGVYFPNLLTPNKQLLLSTNLAAYIL